MNFKQIILLIVSILPLKLIGQESISIRGFIKDAISKEPIESATIYVDSMYVFAESDERGYYELILPSFHEEIVIVVSRVDCQSKTKKLSEIPSKNINFLLSPLSSNLDIIVLENSIERTGIKRENIQELIRLPNASGNIESLLSGIGLGVNTGLGGEVSSQYNVRGGNYDENLVYINGFQVYRPQLIRTSVSEGLTFANPDLIQKLTFSSGGFHAKYGDKLSSVLDVRYKRPESFGASVGIGLLGGTFHMEGKKLIGESQKAFRYLIGLRYKNTQPLLNTFDTENAATANFGDLQGYFTYQVTPSIEFSYLYNFSDNQYKFVPKNSTTIASASKVQTFVLSSTFLGAERTDYKNLMNGIGINYSPQTSKNAIYLNFSASLYNNQEKEFSDLLTLYQLQSLDTKVGSTFGEVIDTIATGGQYDFIRNQLDINISSLSHKGGIEFESSSKTSFFLQWGINYQKEVIKDKILELERKGTEAYTEQIPPESIPITMQYDDQHNLSSNRYSGFIQNSFTRKKTRTSDEVRLTTGIRAAYWNLNRAFFISPRTQFFYAPSKSISYHIATGLYYQSPFYRELRTIEFDINREVLPQKSWHMIVGLKRNINFKKQEDKNFQLTVEAYYKKLWDLITYDIEDVRIQYAGDNNAQGHAYGLDVRLNGNLTPNSESWINMSFLRTRESIHGVQHKRTASNTTAENISSVPRPTDRFLNLSIFFQDHLPSFKRLETYVNYNIGTGLPYNFENEIIFRNNLRYRPNHQLNIGFLFSLWKESYRSKKPRHWLGFSKDAWISFDVINVLNIRTVSSNRLIPTADGIFLVPNLLTSRTMNVRFKVNL